jgi:hypothetical protein
VTRLLTLDTIDVQIFEERTGNRIRAVDDDEDLEDV